LIDILAIGQSAFPEANQTILDLSAEFVKLNEYVNKAVSDIARSDAAEEGPIGRLAVARELAQNITQPSERIFVLANKYSAQMYDIDPSVRTLISMAPEAIKEEGGRDAVCTFFDGVNTMARSAHEMVTQLDGFRESLTQSEALSRDLRPPLRKTRQGLTIIVEASSVTDEWAMAIAESPIDCSAPPVE
jgi:hypothetical protein